MRKCYGFLKNCFIKWKSVIFHYNFYFIKQNKVRRKKQLDNNIKKTQLQFPVLAIAHFSDPSSESTHVIEALREFVDTEYAELMQCEPSDSKQTTPCLCEARQLTIDQLAAYRSPSTSVFCVHMKNIKQPDDHGCLECELYYTVRSSNQLLVSVIVRHSIRAYTRLILGSVGVKCVQLSSPTDRHCYTHISLDCFSLLFPPLFSFFSRLRRSSFHISQKKVNDENKLNSFGLGVISQHTTMYDEFGWRVEKSVSYATFSLSFF